MKKIISSVVALGATVAMSPVVHAAMPFTEIRCAGSPINKSVITWKWERDTLIMIDSTPHETWRGPSIDEMPEVQMQPPERNSHEIVYRFKVARIYSKHPLVNEGALTASREQLSFSREIRIERLAPDASNQGRLAVEYSGAALRADGKAENSWTLHYANCRLTE